MGSETKGFIGVGGGTTDEGDGLGDKVKGMISDGWTDR